MLDCTIYFIRCVSLKAIKIGQAGNPGKRLAEMQVGCPADLVMYGKCHGTKEDEKMLHAKFRSQKIRGEWFTETPEMMEFIDNVIAKGMPSRTEQDAKYDQLCRKLYAPISDEEYFAELKAMRESKT